MYRQPRNLIRTAQVCFALGVLLGLAALVLELAGCWANPPVLVKERIVKVYVHDVPRTCDGLPEFPSVSTIADPDYVRHVSNWIIVASVCLQAPVYPVAELLDVKQWRVQLAPPVGVP